MVGIDGVAFIHGGGHGAWVWDDVRSLLVLPSIAIDLPGKGMDDTALAEITHADWVEHASAEIIRQDWEKVLLVGHSLAGITLPGVARTVGEVAHLLYMSCMVPFEGGSAYDSMPVGGA